MAGDRVGCERSPGLGKERRKGGRKTSLEEALRLKEKSEGGFGAREGDD